MHYILEIRNFRQNKLTITELCERIIDIRYKLRVSIDKLEPIYVSTTIIGSFAIGNIYKFKIYDINTIATTIIFFIMQGIFLVIIYGVSTEREDLLDIIRQGDFINSYINKENNNYFIKILEKSPERKQYRKILKKSPVRKRHRRLNSLEEFNLVLTPTKQKMTPFFNNYRNIKSKSEDFTDNKKIEELADNYNKDIYMKSIYELSTNANNSIDWIILNTLLKDEWSTFSLLGLKFSDGSAVKKAITITGILITASNYITDYLFQ